MDTGKLVPVLVDEILPGDTVNLTTNLFGRLNTPLNPIMDNMFLDIHYFFVPCRLVWDNWEKFNGAQDNPGDSTDYLIPQISAPSGGFAEDSIYDHMGIPTKVENVSINALPLRAYNLIYNEWYRDENLQDSYDVETDDGPDTSTQYQILTRGKRRDYFTSCLPFPQKGEEVTLPLGSAAPVVSDNGAIKFASTVDSTSRSVYTYNSGTGGDRVGLISSPTASGQAIWGDSTGLEADLSSATAANINAIREAFQLQKLYERDARGGTRYVEMVKSHFGVTIPDYRLQRPELLHTNSAMVNINPVAQTSESATTPQGTLAAIGTVSSIGKRFVKSFVEHGYLIGIASFRADLNYQQGLDKMWSRSTRFDFYYPSLAHLGEQAVLNKEIYLQGNSADEEVFGYNERFSEYRFKNSMVTGEFRSNHTVSLDDWHLSQDFGSLPTLNDTFIQENPPINRVVAVPTAPDFLLDCYFQYNHIRPMPTYAIPGYVDHF
jgi:hypothetical protein